MIFAPSSLLRISSVYAAGLLINRGIDFALLPLYTNVFSPEEYGAVALSFMLLAFGHVVYALGFGPAFLRHAAFHTPPQTARLFLGVTVILGAAALVLSIALALNADAIASQLGIAGHAGLIDRVAIVLFLDTFTLLPYAIMRAQEKASLFVACTTLTTVVQVSCTVYLIVFAGMGPEAIFDALIVGAGLNAVVAALAVRDCIRLPVVFAGIGNLARFGMPFVPAGLASVAIDLIDRVMLERFTDVATVGIYSAGYRIAAGMGLLVRAFEYAWAPYVLNRSAEAGRSVRRGMAGFLVVASAVWVVFWLWGEWLIRLELFGQPLLGPAYLAGAGVIPVVMAAYIASGICEALTARLYVAGRSWIVPLAAITGAAVNIAGNLWLIPAYGMMGAAYATALAYIAVAAILWGYIRRL